MQPTDGQQFRKIVEAAARDFSVAALPASTSRLLADLGPVDFGPALTINPRKPTFDATSFFLPADSKTGEYGMMKPSDNAYLRNLRIAPDVLAKMLRNVLEAKSPDKNDAYRSLTDLQILGFGSSGEAEYIAADVTLVDTSSNHFPVHLSLTRPSAEEVRILIFQDQAPAPVGAKQSVSSNPALPSIQISLGLLQLIGALIASDEKRSNELRGALNLVTEDSQEKVIRQAMSVGITLAAILLSLGVVYAYFRWFN